MFRTGCFLILAFSISAKAAIPNVKVLIAKSLDQVVVEGFDLHKTIHTHNITKQYQGKKAISFNCRPRALNINNQKSPRLVASLRSPTGLISWGKNKYQGELHLLSRPQNPECDLVNNIPLEAYITTLLAKEMHGSWPVEALKAQAVAARTYAFERLKRGGDSLYDLESSEKDQVSGSFFDATENTLKASKETEGEILVGPSGKISPAFFHSKCGGRTLRPDQVWGGVEEGYRSVGCTFCHKTGRQDWKHKIQNPKMVQMVDQVLKRYYSDQISDANIRLMPDAPENSEIRLYSGDRLHIIKKSYLRNLAGREILPSNNFILTSRNKEFQVDGQGYGHGVGMCQLGALELAKRGYDYRQILAFYFPRHKITTAYRQ
jgi:stage II sporulation protein D